MNTSTHRYEDENVKITCPIYCGVSHEVARSILEILRNKTASEERTEGTLKVQTATVTKAQTEIEQRLRIDLYTLRHVLFNSLKTGMQLDLALRLQQEVQDELVFMTEDNIQEALQNAVNHYKRYA